MRKRKVWIYARTSHETAGSSDVINRMVSELMQFAKENDMDVVGWSFDECVGVGLDRDGLNQGVRAIRCGDANAILVSRADRISRETPETLEFYQMLKGLGAELISKNDGNVQEALEKILGSIQGKHEEVR